MRKRPASPAPPPITEEDRRLFQDAIGPVRPHTPPEAPGIVPERPAPEPRQFWLDEARVRDELLDMPIDPAEMEIGEELSYLRDGYRPELLKRLKRGAFSIADEMDLHQMTAEVARSAIVTFLADARHRGLTCVKLIHGKGLRSRPGGPVIKRLVDRMLRQRDDVVAFASARPELGGTGATVVLLRHR
ncbi:Smr/MutS family protein [Tahibacter amnicola]|uniref:Smr/MutS family protein n=1 Tax=Tahibacter amnicola TaxID=2976241 RepID=A0ABY6BJR6_9GAMM|nr:Smr/MutS family protein [Tahibacter amnicola]UXI69712.1 Smr/MutS family protein [Tahibacter amnicola]